MDLPEPALFAQLLPATQTAIRSVAEANGLPIDDVVQARLGRWWSRGEGALLTAQTLHGEVDEAVLNDVMKLDEVWPMPGPSAAFYEKLHTLAHLARTGEWIAPGAQPTS